MHLIVKDWKSLINNFLGHSFLLLPFTIGLKLPKTQFVKDIYFKSIFVKKASIFLESL